MNNFSDKKRRIGGLLLEVLVLIFVFSSSWSQTEFTKKAKDETILKASPVEQIAFRDSDSYLKSLLDFISKIQISEGGFTFFTIDLPASGNRKHKLPLHFAFFIQFVLYSPHGESPISQIPSSRLDAFCIISI